MSSRSFCKSLSSWDMGSSCCAVVCRCEGSGLGVGVDSWSNIGLFSVVSLTSSEVMGSSSSVFNFSSIMVTGIEGISDAGLKSAR